MQATNTLLLAATALIFCPLMSWASDHYVSPNGSASWGSCTSSSAPCSKSTAESNATSGDRVLFMEGTYTGGLRIAQAGSCSSHLAPDSQKIILQSLYPRKAILTGNNAAATYSTVLVDSPCVSVRDFKIEIPDQNNTVFGLYLTREGNEALGNEIYYAGTQLTRSGYRRAMGIRINASAFVQGNYIHDATIGVSILGTTGGAPFDADISGNTVKNLAAGDPEESDCFVVNRNGVTGFGVGIRIFGNTCTGWIDDGFDGFDATGVQVFNNSFATSQPSLLSGFNDHPTCLKIGYTSKGQMIHSNHCAAVATTPPQAHCIDAQGAEAALVADNYCQGGYNGIYLQAGSGTGLNNRFVRNTIVGSQTFALSVVSVVEGTVLNGNFLDSSGTHNLQITSGATINGQNNVFGKTTTVWGSGIYTGTGDIVAPH